MNATNMSPLGEKDTLVPGGQRTYIVSSSGELKFTPAGPYGAVPQGSIYPLSFSAVDGGYLKSSQSYGTFYACPVSGSTGVYQIWTAKSNQYCVGINLKVVGVPAGTIGAYLYS